jgi:hypothetical protein
MAGRGRRGWVSRHEDEPTLAEFFSAAALISFAAANGRRTTKEEACRWSLSMGERMARASRRRRERVR